MRNIGSSEPVGPVLPVHRPRPPAPAEDDARDGQRRPDPERRQDAEAGQDAGTEAVPVPPADDAGQLGGQVDEYA